MGPSEVWMSFSEEQRAILKRALKKRARDMVGDEFRLANEYWRKMKARSKFKKPEQADLRHNQAYRDWLAANNLPTDPFDSRAYQAWKRGFDRWTK